jgi:uncharacterized membrane protein YraQ (UPF0718 family)
MKRWQRYWFSMVMITVLMILVLLNHHIGIESAETIAATIKSMGLIIPPIFILLGLMDIWVPCETMIKYMGEDSGGIGILLAFALGSAAAGPLYGAFPVAGVLMSKGAKFTNVLIFMGAWSTTKIPMFIFEMVNLGSKFALTRLLIDIPGVIIIAYILSAMLGKETIAQIYRNN